MYAKQEAGDGSPSNASRGATCDECGSLFSISLSSMNDLCPECAHLIYEYPNCEHRFVSGRFERCWWDGSTADYIGARSQKRSNE